MLGELERFAEERKRKLDGRVLRYRCRALEVTPGRAVLLYRLEQAVDLPGLHIPANAVSYGVYWPDRPYNVYHWVDAGGLTLGYYCNVATDTQITDHAVDWLDLEADVLITPGGGVQVLDLDEVPADLTPEHRAVLETALAALREPAAVVGLVESLTSALRAHR